MAPERIVGAALALVDEQGADALSMRALAQQLDSGTATLYRHFANRAQLVARVVDCVFGEVDLDAAELVGQGWQTSCEVVARTMLEALGRHPGVARLLLERTPMGPNAMAIREKCVAMLLDSGFAPELAARTYATLSRYVLGFAIQFAERPTDEATERHTEAFADVDVSRFPATAALAGAMPLPLEVEFAFGLELIVLGLDRIQNG